LAAPLNCPDGLRLEGLRTFLLVHCDINDEDDMNLRNRTESAPLAYSVEEAAGAAGLGRNKIYEAVTAGLLPAKKVGKRTIILAEDLRAYLVGLPAAFSAGARS